MRSDEIKSHDCDSATESQRREWGCDEPSVAAEWEIDGLKMDRCVGYYTKHSPEWVSRMFQIYNWRDKGILPYPGPLIHQPHLIVEAIDYMDYLFGIKYAPKNQKRSKK